MAKQLEHQQKADGIKAERHASHDVDGIKVAGTLAETQRDLVNELENRADAEYLV